MRVVRFAGNATPTTPNCHLLNLFNFFQIPLQGLYVLFWFFNLFL